MGFGRECAEGCGGEIDAMFDEHDRTEVSSSPCDRFFQGAGDARICQMRAEVVKNGDRTLVRLVGGHPRERCGSVGRLGDGVASEARVSEATHRGPLAIGEVTPNGVEEGGSQPILIVGLDDKQRVDTVELAAKRFNEREDVVCRVA
jgi:hypothetical protein